MTKKLDKRSKESKSVIGNLRIENIYNKFQLQLISIIATVTLAEENLSGNLFGNILNCEIYTKQFSTNYKHVNVTVAEENAFREFP